MTTDAKHNGLPGGPDNDVSTEWWEHVRTRLGLPEAVRPDLLRQAFSHTSFVREAALSSTGSNQRLEFLGDAVLDLLLVEHLYRSHPDLPEGLLTKMRAAAARSQTLARVARSMDLGAYMLLGRGEQETGGRQKPSLLGDCLEALVGAVYLSVGLDTTRELVLDWFREALVEIEAQQDIFDHKTALQELLQSRIRKTPTYHTVTTLGPPHERIFQVEVRVNSLVIGRGQGTSKQSAQQAAARDALENDEGWKGALG